MSDIITINGKNVSLIKAGVNNHLTAKQKALLIALYDCMKKEKIFSWDVMVNFYVKNVKSYYLEKNYDYDFFKNNKGKMVCAKTNERYDKIDIKNAYQNNDNVWHYNIRPSIRQWFSTNIGSMVLKGSILALPIIEID